MATPTGLASQSCNECTRPKRYIEPGTKGEMIMDAQDIIELIEYLEIFKTMK